MDPRTIILFTRETTDRATARDLVASRDHEIEELASAEEALASLLDDPCAVALVDLDAPGAEEMLRVLRGAPKQRMPILGATRRAGAEGASLCDHVEVGPRPFLLIAAELALALEEIDALRPGQRVVASRTGLEIGVVRAVREDGLVVHLHHAGRRTMPLEVVERVDGEKVLVDTAALSGEIGDAVARDHDERDEPMGRTRSRAPRTRGEGLRRTQRRPQRGQGPALRRFAVSLAARWAA